MRRFSDTPFSSRTAVLLSGGLLCVMVTAGCADAGRAHSTTQLNPCLIPDTRYSILLSSSAGKEHRAVMLQHLETIQVIMNALVEEDNELAQGLTEAHVAFFRRRQAMAHQEPEKFPAAYYDQAVVHHEAAAELARVIPSKDLKQILPSVNNVLKACVACHLEYRVGEG